jgi:class 3 adenylate cyclase
LAQGGGICISGTAYDQVKDKLQFEYEPLGEQTVKNIPEPALYTFRHIDPFTEKLRAFAGYREGEVI